jgi:hypothetical protein
MNHIRSANLAFIVTVTAACGHIHAATIWINDWDTPQERMNWEEHVTITDSSSADFQASADLDGNGVYGGVQMGKGTTVWGPNVVEAPPGCTFRNIVLTWVWVAGHKPTGSSFSMSLSHLGVFQGEQRTASTAGAQGFQRLTLNTSDIPEFQGLSRVTVRLKGTHWADWKLGGSGLYMTADIIGPGPAENPEKGSHMATGPQPHDGGRSRTDVVLRWQPGAADAASDGQDVYMGTDRGLVSDATTSSTGVYRGRQAKSAFDTAKFAPRGLTRGEDYYWRVDQVSGKDVRKGDVWHFTVDRGDRCVVEPHTDLFINGHGSIEPQIFSLTAYEGGSDFDPVKNGAKGLEFCQEYGVEGLGFAFPPGHMTPPQPKHFWNDMTMDEVRHWLKDPQGAQKRFDHGPMPVVFGRVLPALREIGVQPFMYAYGPEPGTSGCKEGDCAERLIEVSTHCIGMWLKAYPEFRYAHLWGEPSARWFRLDCGGHTCGAADYAEFFNRWAKAVHERYPQMKLGGPVHWGTPTTHTGWEGWCKTLIDEAHEELDFLDWHAYGTPSISLEGDLHASTAYAKMNYGKWLRHSVSETNNAQNFLKRDEWYDYATHYRKRVPFMAEQTFRFLRNPDKVFDRQVHDYSAWAGTYNVKFSGHDALPQTPMMHMFRIFKPLRGRRVVTENPFDDVMLEAAVLDDRLTVALMNLSPEPRRVPVSIGFAAGDVTDRSAAILTADGPVEYEAPPASQDTVFDMPALSIVVAVYRTFVPVKPAKRIRRWEYFSDDLMMQVTPNGLWQVETTIRLNDVVRRSAASATLRFGINRNDDFVPPSWTVRVDGEPYVIEKTTHFEELRLRAVPEGNLVRVSVTCNEPPPIDYVVSFASVVLSGDADRGPPVSAPQEPQRTQIWSNDFGTDEQRKQWSDFATDDAGSDLDGDGRGGFIQLPDTRNHLWGTQRIEAPAGQVMKNLLVEWDVYRATANGADWQVALSPTGKFAGEQVIVHASPGLGRVTVRFDVTGRADFEDLSAVHLRLAGSNGPLAWSSKASQVKLSGTLGSK